MLRNLLSGIAAAALAGCAATGPVRELRLNGTKAVELGKTESVDGLLAKLQTPDDVASYCQMTFRYRRDSPIDYWNSIGLTIENGHEGDCEDAATVAYVALLGKGYDTRILMTARDANPKKGEKGPAGHVVAVYGKEGRYGIIGNSDDEFTGLIFPSLEAAARWHCGLWGHTHYRYYDLSGQVELLKNGRDGKHRENLEPVLKAAGFDDDFQKFTPKPQ
jgi:hypothetical protein